MIAKILDGVACSKNVRQEIAEMVTKIKHQQSPPALGIILVGEDLRSKVYVQNKARAAQQVGIECTITPCSPNMDTDGMLHVIETHNIHPAYDGFIIQLPLPSHIDIERIVDAIDPNKDVDCFHPFNQGLLLRGTPRFMPATPRGILELLKRNDCPVAGKHVVILGRSTIVGRPLAAALLLKGACGDATVTVAHSQTRHLEDVCKEADILVVAIGNPRFVNKRFVKEGAVVVDVGINKIGDKLCGDVDFDSVKKVASAITPVPGGIGPMTVAMLLCNTIEARLRRASVLSR